ncbi:MAG: ferrous iron transport protein B [Ignavibacteriales bacterium]
METTVLSEIKAIKNLRLSDLKTGDEGIITKVTGHGAFRKRITEMGFVKGKKVKVIKNAPLQDPVEYEIMDYKVSLRRSEAHLVEVITPDLAHMIENIKFEGMIDEETLKTTAGEKVKSINVALVGNPNCGKTTLYNYASGSRERVGNYGGVTVDAREATFRQSSYLFTIADLPGTYSITEYTPEELYVRTHITDKMPDVVVNVVDASNLERNLYLTTQLIDMNIKVVIALNMYDELHKTGAHFDYKALGQMIGVPIIPTVASKGRGIHELFEKIIDVYEDRDPVVRHIHINYGSNIESAISRIQPLIKENKNITDKYSSRYLTIKLLENDKTTIEEVLKSPNGKQINETLKTEVQKLEKEYGERSSSIITDAKYGFISGALNETFTPGIEEKRKKTANIDLFLTHRLFGFPIFIFFMWLMFQATFSVGKYPMDWIDSGVGLLSDFVKGSMPPGPLLDLLVDGVIGGVGGVIVFLPNILILFFFISFMEDTGYMARASFIMDKLMHKIGLHGKSFIPMVMGFGCNVPAIMATRTLENRKDRILTMLITPFMSCSARLPVYVVLISAFFPHNQGLVLVSIYFIGVVVAVLVALIMKRIFFKKQEVPFVMELPPYRIPTLKNTSVHMWHKAVQYLKKMGTVILLASILIWGLGYFPRDAKFTRDYDREISLIKSDGSLKDNVRMEKISSLELEKESERQENSYIGRMGHFIEPVIRPLGFDWKIGVSILTGLAAKEIVVGTMGVLYQADFKADENTGNLQKKLQEQTHSHGSMKGQKVFTPLVAYALMLFVLLYFPCVAVIAAIRKESDWKWAAFTMGYTTLIAWVVSFLTYQIGSMF